MLPVYYEFQNQVKLLSGKNALENIAFELRNLNAVKPFILSSRTIYTSGLLNIITDVLEDEGIKPAIIFTDIPPDSSLDTVNNITSFYRTFECDSIIAVGGGSVLDTAKGLKLLLSQNSNSLKDLMGSEIINRGIHIPFVAVPTTSGTGSETTLVAVISDIEKNVKMEFISYNLLPDVAVLDVRMLVGLPPRITVSTGMDAMCHAIEAYTSLQKNPLSDAYAQAAIKLISDYLPRAMMNGNDKEARLALANAAFMSGASFSNSMVGIVHAMGHSLGAVCHISHGEAISILLPHCMNFNYDMAGELYGEIYLQIKELEYYVKLDSKDRGRETIRFIQDMCGNFNKICGFPIRLRDVNVKKEDFDTIAKNSMDDGAIMMNCKSVGYEDIIKILEDAY